MARSLKLEELLGSEQLVPAPCALRRISVSIPSYRLLEKPLAVKRGRISCSGIRLAMFLSRLAALEAYEFQTALPHVAL